MCRKGWEELTSALESDATLRETFFSRVKVYFFAGAGLSQAAWDRLQQVTERHCGERIRIMAGLGMTETSPSCLFTTLPAMCAGYVGVPAPGCEVKLVPVAGKLEARFRGPHVMRGYWRMDSAATAKSFDEEGYYCSGDALKFVDPQQPELGLMFDGRIAEDFKLSSGTFVSVGPMRRARYLSRRSVCARRGRDRTQLRRCRHAGVPATRRLPAARATGLNRRVHPRS